MVRIQPSPSGAPGLRGTKCGSSGAESGPAYQKFSWLAASSKCPTQVNGGPFGPQGSIGPMAGLLVPNQKWRARFIAKRGSMAGISPIWLIRRWMRNSGDALSRSKDQRSPKGGFSCALGSRMSGNWLSQPDSVMNWSRCRVVPAAVCSSQALKVCVCMATFGQVYQRIALTPSLRGMMAMCVFSLLSQCQ